MNAYFDADAFLEALNMMRLAKGTTWKRLSEESGVPLGTLNYIRLRLNKPSMDTFALLIAWSGLDANEFITRHVERETTP